MNVRSRPATREVHAQQRAYERYGVALSGEDIEAIRGMVKRWECLAVWPMRSGRYRVKLQYQSHLLIVVYDKRIDAIVTVLPPHSDGAVERHGKRRRSRYKPKGRRE